MFCCFDRPRSEAEFFNTIGSEPTSDAVQHQLNLSYRWRHNRPKDEAASRHWRIWLMG